jgi:hypothetical protein
LRRQGEQTCVTAQPVLTLFIVSSSRKEVPLQNFSDIPARPPHWERFFHSFSEAMFPEKVIAIGFPGDK